MQFSLQFANENADDVNCHLFEWANVFAVTSERTDLGEEPQQEQQQHFYLKIVFSVNAHIICSGRGPFQRSFTNNSPFFLPVVCAGRSESTQYARPVNTIVFYFAGHGFLLLFRARSYIYIYFSCSSLVKFISFDIFEAQRIARNEWISCNGQLAPCMCVQIESNGRIKNKNKNTNHTWDLPRPTDRLTDCELRVRVREEEEVEEEEEREREILRGMHFAQDFFPLFIFSLNIYIHSTHSGGSRINTGEEGIHQFISVCANRKICTTARHTFNVRCTLYAVECDSGSHFEPRPSAPPNTFFCVLMAERRRWLRSNVS